MLAITVLHIFEIKIVNSAHLYTTKTYTNFKKAPLWHISDKLNKQIKPCYLLFLLPSSISMQKTLIQMRFLVLTTQLRTYLPYTSPNGVECYQRTRRADISYPIDEMFMQK